MATLRLVYVNAYNSVSVTVTDRDKARDIENYVQEELLRLDPMASDDFWIDDAYVEFARNSIDVKDLLDSRLDDKDIENILEDENFVYKAIFLKDQGFDIDEDNLEQVQVMEASPSDLETSGEKGYVYPTDFIEEYAQEFFSDLYKALDRNSAMGYFEWTYLFRDMEFNGGLRAKYYEAYDMFIYSFSLR